MNDGDSTGEWNVGVGDDLQIVRLSCQRTLFSSSQCITLYTSLCEVTMRRTEKRDTKGNEDFHVRVTG